MSSQPAELKSEELQPEVVAQIHRADFLEPGPPTLPPMPPATLHPPLVDALPEHEAGEGREGGPPRLVESLDLFYWDGEEETA